MIFLVLYCFLLLLSIFTASWRISLGALGLQSIGMGAYLISNGQGIEWHHSVAIAELILIKGIAVPLFLVHRFNRAGVPRFVDLIPANLLHWTIATFFVAFAYLAASELAPGNSRDVMLIGAALSAIALGMLTLSSQNNLPGQLISILTIENGISLFAIDGRHETPLMLELFVGLDFMVLVVLASNFLRRILPEVTEPDGTHLDSAARESTMQSMTSTDYGDVL